MYIVAINGSPYNNGNCAFLLNEIKKHPKNHRAISTLADLYHFHACRLNDKAVHFALDALEELNTK